MTMETEACNNASVLSRVVGRLLLESSKTMAVAESCTGGYLSDLLTDVSGSSAYFLGGLVVYSNKLKEKILTIKPEDLLKHGAVSETVALAMAANTRTLTGADITLSLTGIAGPEGGTAEKPVGLVYIALATAEEVNCKKFNFQGERKTIKDKAATAALNMLQEKLLSAGE